MNKKLIMEVADAMVEEGYLDVGYEYLIINSCLAEHFKVSEDLLEDKIK